MSTEHQLDIVLLEQRPERGAYGQLRTVFEAGVVRRTVKERDTPRPVLRCLKVRRQPRELLLTSRRRQECGLGVEGNEVHRAVVEAVEALGVIRIGDAGAVTREHEQRAIGRRGPGPVVVIANRREDRLLPQPRCVVRKEERVELLICAVAVGDVADVQREIEGSGADAGGHLSLPRRSVAAVAECQHANRTGSIGRSSAQLIDDVWCRIDAGDAKIVLIRGGRSQAGQRCLVLIVVRDSCG